MTAGVAGVAETWAGAPAVSVRRAYLFELVKLLAPWRIRVLLAVCWTLPGVFVAVVSRQSSLPADTVFGRWMPMTGWAGALVTLAFCCQWVLPLLAAVVAGDVFAVEDRLGTWRHLLVACRSPRRIFVTKVLTSLTVIVLLVAGLAVSSAVGGLLSVGNHALVGLDGHSLTPAHAAGSVGLAWLAVLAPTLAFTAVGLLGSVVLGRSPMGLLVPVLLALLMQLAQLLPLPVSVRLALPSYSFLAWRGLFVAPAALAPLLVGVVVSLVWAVVATALAFAIFRRRDFTDGTYDGSPTRLLASAVPLVGLVVAAAVVIGVPAPSGSGIAEPQVERSLSTAFTHLYRLQAEQLHRPVSAVAGLRVSSVCDKGGPRVSDQGAGNDWRCAVTWRVAGVDSFGTAIYQLDVTPDGRYVADGDGPKGVNGYFQVRTSHGDAPNPLWQVDGNLDLLNRDSKG